MASIDNALATNESVSRIRSPRYVLMLQQDSPLRAAALRAVTTVTFIVPEKAVPAFVRGIQERLKAENFSPLGTYEYGVWATPSGVTFVDGKSYKIVPLKRLSRSQSSVVEERPCCPREGKRGKYQEMGR